jgi:hypothetical protein
VSNPHEPRTDGTGVNYVFHPEIWPQIDTYFGELASALFTTHGIPRSSVKVIRIGMDKTGEFNFPYVQVFHVHPFPRSFVASFRVLTLGW